MTEPDKSGRRALKTLRGFLVGEEPAELWARGESFLKEGVEDVVFCYLRFPSGTTAHMPIPRLKTRRCSSSETPCSSSQA